MIVKIRLEAEGQSLEEVAKDIEAATRAAKFLKELQVHDEHYERTDSGFKGRRVLSSSPKMKTPIRRHSFANAPETLSSSGTWTINSGGSF